MKRDNARWYQMCQLDLYCAQEMGYVDDINFFEENVATVKNNVEILPQASKEIALKLSKDKIKYINMTSNQNQKHI